MTAPVTVYTHFPKKALELTLALGTLKCMFVTATYTPDQDAHDYVDDVSANEATGTSYAAGGVTLGSPTVLIDTATNKLTIDADNITTAGLSVPCRWGILYIATGTPSTSPLIAYVDFSGGGNTTVTEVDWDAAGIVPWTVA